MSTGARSDELGDDTNFIQFGYWDNLKKGLLAGERLAHDLKRMDGLTWSRTGAVRNHKHISLSYSIQFN
jgi:hypothetical protein